MQTNRVDMAQWIPGVVGAALALVASWPLWVVRHTPIQDLPQHVAAVRVIADFGRPEYRFAEYFELTLGRTQYLSVYLLAAAFAKLLGPLVATKLVLTLSWVATPPLLGRLLAALRMDRWLALLCLPLLFNAHVILGFVNFVAAIPLMLWGLALAVEERDQPRRRRRLGLALVMLLCFYTHVIPFGLLALGALLLAGGRKTLFLERLACFAPSLVAALFWMFSSPAGMVVVELSGLSAQTSPTPHRYASVTEALRAWPDWMIDVLPGAADDERWAAWLLVMTTLGMVSALRPRADCDGPLSSAPVDRLTQLQGGPGSHRPSAFPRYVIGSLVPVSVLLFFVLPTAYGFVWPISQRFPILAAILAIVLVARAPVALGRLGAVAAVVLALVGAREQTDAFVRFERQAYAGFEAILSRIPLGSRVAGLIFDRNSPEVRFTPLLHAVAWVQVDRGGAVMFTFADFPQSPFHFRADNRPPRVGARWEWSPQMVIPDHELQYYDYVLVRGSRRTMGTSTRFQLVESQGPWSLYQQRDPGSS